VTRGQETIDRLASRPLLIGDDQMTAGQPSADRAVSLLTRSVRQSRDRTAGFADLPLTPAQRVTGSTRPRSTALRGS
jgi:hypothetical protein